MEDNKTKFDYPLDRGLDLHPVLDEIHPLVSDLIKSIDSRGLSNEIYDSIKLYQ